MSNKSLFSKPKKNVANSVNEAGGTAYLFGPKHALAQYAVTGCLNQTFYATAEDQLEKVLDLLSQNDPEFIAKTAIYARKKGFMKDLPALFLVKLSIIDKDLFKKIFRAVIDTPKMLRNFVQIIRSGKVDGRKSLGTLPKQMVKDWLNLHSPEKIFIANVGQDPSLVDIIKMVHPRCYGSRHRSLYRYLLGKDYDKSELPVLTRQYEEFKVNPLNHDIPNVPFQMLTSLDLNTDHWKEIAKNAPWQMTRMNLNTFQRHGVFEDKKMINLIADRLRDSEQIKKSRVFPYQIFAAWKHINEGIPKQIKDALKDAMEIAIENIPEIEGKIYVFPDVSGSMQCPITGQRKGSVSKINCIDVAALITAAVVRKNPKTKVWPFDTNLYRVKKSEFGKSVMKNVEMLSDYGGGGTNCSLPMIYLNKQKKEADLVIYVSDSESWVDSDKLWGRNQRTETLKQWDIFRGRNPNAKLICIDLQPYDSTQTLERDDIINVGGFSDQVFQLIADVSEGKIKKNYWVNQIEEIEIT